MINKEIKTALIFMTGFVFFSQAFFVSAQQVQEIYKSAKRYNLAGQITGSIGADPDGSGPLGFPAVRNTYNEGKLVKVENGYLASWQNELVKPSSWSSFVIQNAKEIQYNSRGQKIVELTRGSDGILYARKEYNYTEKGNVLCEAIRMNPANYSLAYSKAGVCQIQSTGTYGPDRIRRFIYDNFNNVEKEYRAYDTSLEHVHVEYTYEKTYLVKTVKDANGNIAEMEYDDYSRKTKWKFPDKYLAGVVNEDDYEEYDYDNKGNRIYLRKRDGSEIYYHHDHLDRVVHKDYVLVGEKDVYYRYDLRDLQTEAYFPGAGSKITTVYNGFGELTDEINKVSGVNYTISHNYDKNGNRESTTYFDGEYFEYGYDSLDRLATIKENGSTTLITSKYDNFAQPESQTTSGNVKTTLGYDSVGRVDEVDLNVSGGSFDLTYGFNYNPASQIVKQSLSNSNFDYSGPGGKTGTYNVNHLNQYENVDGVQFYHDENGNLTFDGDRDYIYDTENRLIFALKDGEDISFGYDPSGRLISYDVEGARTHFIYSGDNLIAELVDNNITKRYLHASNMGTPLVQYEGSEVGSSSRQFIHTNHQGSVISATASNGFAEYVNTYDAYGVPGSGNQGRFAYTGQMYLPELGFYHYRARVYDPGIGRFLQTDPVGYEDQVNLYAYVHNDPVNIIDPSGEFGLYADKGISGNNTPLEAVHARQNSRNSSSYIRQIGKQVNDARVNTHIVAGSISKVADGVTVTAIAAGQPQVAGVSKVVGSIAGAVEAATDSDPGTALVVHAISSVVPGKTIGEAGSLIKDYGLKDKSGMAERGLDAASEYAQQRSGNEIKEYLDEQMD